MDKNYNSCAPVRAACRKSGVVTVMDVEIPTSAGFCLYNLPLHLLLREEFEDFEKGDLACVFLILGSHLSHDT